ncbi:MAG: winged helix-turn-helix transcriptional regulator [Candidatus Micrarchaeota archaeon]|nr:winged helix-turn-helix transcriptional regulator [Candidatus Micrarchaeota archaeon]
MNDPHYELFFETLANRLRMRILLATMSKPMPVSEIMASVGEEQSKVSHALNALRACKLVRLKINGREHLYEANREILVPLLHLVDNYACRECGGACGNAACKQTARKERRQAGSRVAKKAGRAPKAAF